MESLLGITAKDCVIIAADSTTAHSISVMKHDQNKMFKLGKNMAMVISGEAGDPSIFGDFMQKNLALYSIKNQYSLGPHGAAHYIRRTLAESIRSRRPYGVHLLLAGCSEDEGSCLYYMDYLGSLAKVPFGAHGYGAYFSLSIMDRLHKKDCDREEAISIVRECIKEIQHRLIINLPSFKIYAVTKDSVEEIEDLSMQE
ncbi:proteasome subunit beta type-2-like [Sycon ciliatum]|uniref:proteasome subunit beta type-2-like n=1 Tax=Sycon ciliatum TaxID=27933 RepID=UPI0020AAFE66|eukprot:scpid93178/ scgid21698/ Proteasome subunit beta type-2; Macropain subunit C7-I; Multicatalytic endopeptidase complex subunit C7-I; Proteasome component C7-I